MPSEGQSRAPEHLTAVVVAFRSTAHLTGCVDALRAAGVTTIVIVDNNDDDADAGTIGALSAASSGHVQVITTGRNLGFGAACNVGAAAALDSGADVLWFVNPDTRVQPDAARLVADAMQERGFALASPLLTTGEPGRETVWFGGGTFDARTGRTRHEFLGAPVAAVPREPREATFLNGAALAVTRAAWTSLSGFSEDYFLYWEDSDLSLRATRAGLRLGVVPAAVVWHAEGASSAGDDPGRSALGYFYHTRNRLVLACHIGRLLGWAVGPGLVLTLKPIGAALLTERVGRWRKTAAALRGTWEGLRCRTGPDHRANRRTH